MATLSYSSAHLILHRFILRGPSLSFPHTSSLFSSAKQSLPLKLKTTPSYPFTPSLFFFTPTRPCATSPHLENDVALLDNNASPEPETETSTSSPASDVASRNLLVPKPPPPPSLTVKEKKELASYAHSLGKKLKSQQVGKSGVTGTVVMALVETLEKNELMKLKVHGNCPEELDDVVKQLEETTGSVVVSQIGRTMILYRPSVTKMKAEEKKKQAQIAFLKKQQMSKQWSQSKRPLPGQGQEQRPFGRGRRGSSRV